MPVLPPNAIQGVDADRAMVAAVVDPALPAPPVLASVPADLPIDPLMAAASAPPPVAPLSPVDAALAPALPPAGGPALSVLPPPPPESPPATPLAAAEKNLATAEKLGEEAVSNAKEKVAIDQQAADEKSKLAAETEKAMSALHARQEQHQVEAANRVADARAIAESEPYHTLWQSRTIGENVLTGVGLILGGVSWNANHVNRGVEIVNNAMRENDSLQKAKHADLWRAVEAAEKGQQQLDVAQLRELSRFEARRGAAADAVASRLSAMVAANKGKGDITTAKKEALKWAEEATSSWRNAATADATARHMDEQEKELHRHHLEMEKTSALRAAKYKTRGGGPGGGGSDAAITAMQEAADATGATLGKVILAGKGLPQKERERLAKDMLAAKAKSGAGAALDVKHDEAEANKIIRFDGKPAAIAGTAKIAAKAADEDVQRGDAISRLKELAHDIKVKGGKINPSDSNAVQERVSKFANAIIAIGIVSPLGKTNETLHLETRALGIPGVPDWEHLTDSLRQWVTTNGANLANVERKIEETIRNREAHRAKFQPLTEEQKKKYSSSAGDGDHPDREIKGGGTARWNKERGGYERVADIVL